MTTSGGAGTGVYVGSGGASGFGGGGNGFNGGGGGGAGWLGSGGDGAAYPIDSGAGGATYPSFAGGGGYVGGSRSGGGGGGIFGGGGGGGSYIDGSFSNTLSSPGVNGVPGPFVNPTPSNGVVTINGSAINYTGAIVDYTIPTTGVYDIVAEGAQGGGIPHDIFGYGGYGAEVGGDVRLRAGTELGIVVGEAGIDGALEGNSSTAGGGGGSFVWIVSGPGIVPEPSTWAMTLLGFAGLGWAGWRRARARPAAA